MARPKQVFKVTTSSSEGKRQRKGVHVTLPPEYSEYIEKLAKNKKTQPSNVIRQMIRFTAGANGTDLPRAKGM